MTSWLTIDHWALYAAIGIASVAGIAIAISHVRGGAHGMLRAAMREHHKAIVAHRAAIKSVTRQERRCEKLLRRADTAKPRVIEEAKGALADARALAKITEDRQLVTANLVRKVIFEEFPPTRHERLRRRYLPEDVRDDRPFSFDA